MKKTYKIKDWVRKMRLTTKEMVDENNLIVFKDKKLAEDFGEKHLTPNKLKNKS